jgi:Flp pilus assembly protein TadG
VRVVVPTRFRAAERGQSLVEFALLVPIMLIVLVAILDLARIYTTMMSVESAARESADYGTQFGAGRWQSGPVLDGTVAEMERRACVATSNLRDYQGSASTCTNPSFACSVTAPDYPTAGVSTVYAPCQSLVPAAGCADPLRAMPCRVTVTLGMNFQLLVPLNIDFFGVTLGLPSSLSFTRDSTFAITDIGSQATPEPTPEPPTPAPTDPPTPEPPPTDTPTEPPTPGPPTPEPPTPEPPTPEPQPTPEPPTPEPPTPEPT